jgi:hypothetical protein
MMDALDQKCYCPVEDFTWEQLKCFADAILKSKEDISAKILEAGSMARKKASENIKLCLDLLDRPLF